MKKTNSLLLNSIFSLLATVAVKIANIIAFILIARLTGPHQAGIFSLGTTYLAIFAAITLGFDELLTRQVARDRRTSAEYFSTLLIIRILATIACYLLLFFLVGYGIGYSDSTLQPIILLGLSLIPDNLANVGQALLISHERFKPILFAGIVSSVVKLIGILVANSNGADLQGVALAWFAGSCLAALILFGYAAGLVKQYEVPSWFRIHHWMLVLKQSVPFLTIGLLFALEYQSDVVILSFIRDEAEVSMYTAGTTIVFGLLLLFQSIRNAIYPRMVSLHSQEPVRLVRFFDLSFNYLLAISLPMSLGLTLISPALIGWIYNSSFLDAVIPLQILAWLIVINSVTVLSVRLVLVTERQAIVPVLLAGSLALNIFLNYILDPDMGAAGAAVARICSSLLFILAILYYANRHLQISLKVTDLIKPVIASLIMGTGVWFTLQWSLFLAIFSGITIYPIALLLIRGVTAEERQWLIKFIQSVRWIVFSWQGRIGRIR